MAGRSILVWAVAGGLALAAAAMSPAVAGAPTVSSEDGPATLTPPGEGVGGVEPPARAAPAAPIAKPAGGGVAATPALVRQIQFMLLSIGIDPGPIDGVPRRLTNAAVHKFERKFGLPKSEIVNGGEVSTAFLDRLRTEASSVLLGAQRPAPAAASPAPPSTAETPPAAPAPPAVAAIPPRPEPAPPPADRFASCPYDAADFRIGGTQYTPDSFLQAGFGNSTSGAVTALTERLNEARQIAQQIGGPALKEVQRQARVLHYFQCRLKIEEAAAQKN